VVIPSRDDERMLGIALARYIAPFVDEVVVQGGPGGAGVARNVGASKTTGDIIVFMDDDAWLPHPEQLSWFRQADPTVNLWVPRHLRNKTGHHYTELGCHLITVINRVQGHVPHALGTFMAVSTPAFHKARGFDPDVRFEDTNLGLRLVKPGTWGVAPVEVFVCRKWQWQNPWHASSRGQPERHTEWPSTLELGLPSK
jgi:hypothetical protein